MSKQNPFFRLNASKQVQVNFIGNQKISKSSLSWSDFELFSLNHLPFCSVGRFKRLFGQKPFFHKILCWSYYCLMYLVKNQMASMLKLLCWTVERYLRTIFFIVIISLNLLWMNFIRHMCLSFKTWRQNFYPFLLKTWSKIDGILNWNMAAT